ncbi:diguanylate cyclase domain-containing protein [Geminicoccus flavidas]|uniref:diguanylate cyclase domain-containing protein n=1 Tax=Geminicoccus flavidas TaxID=2506407 RepID=UPI00135B803C|nr:diguanylate cyclase [Geminicoccus flavidas]
MAETLLDVVADSSPLPLAVLDPAGGVVLANRALRLLVNEAVLQGQVALDGRDGRVLLPGRHGGAVALEVIELAGGGGRRVLRGETRRQPTGLREETGGFQFPVGADLSPLDERLLRAARSAAEQDRAVALLLLEPLGMERLAAELGPAAADAALARLDERLRASLRTVDHLLPQEDGLRAVVAVVSGPEGAETLAVRLSTLLAQPLEVEGAERLFGVRIGLAHARAPDLAAILPAARAALAQAAMAGGRFVSLASRTLP